MEMQRLTQRQSPVIKKAILSGANAIVGLRFDRSAQIANATEVLAYGTAVKIKKEEPKAKTLADTGTDVSMMLRTLKRHRVHS